jgi:glycosyltransferase involved in cell wall biosynthesis
VTVPEPTALWVSTSTETKGGVSTFVRSMLTTPLGQRWRISHLASHRDGSTATKVAQFLVALARFTHRMAWHRPSLVHLHVASRGSFFRKATFARIARVFGVPVVAHVHGAMFHVFYAGSPAVVKWLVRDMLAHSAAVVALGDTWAQRLRSIEPRARVIVVPNPIRPVGAAVQPAGGEPVRVLFLGRIEDDKGVFTLIEAWRTMTAKLDGRASAHLTIAGDGEVSRARELVAELGLEPSVDVTGWVDPRGVPEMLRSSQVLVLASRYEGQPMAVLEAMANGLCVISSPVGGIPEMLGDDAGILVPPGDAGRLADELGEVVRNAERRGDLGNAALRRVRERFDVDVAWRQFDGIYRGALR